jgi:hypothetical protein
MVELLIALNWWAVITGAVVYFMLGALWYSPVLFANKWMALMEMSEEDIGEPNPVIFLWSFILQFVGTLSLAIFMEAMLIESAAHGAFIGFGAGAGFVFSLAGTTGLFSDTKLSLHFINNGYHVIGLTIAGTIIGLW